MRYNALNCTDFYKIGHIFQFPDKTQLVYSNLTPRSDSYARVLPDFDHKVVNFGLQGVIQSLLIELWNDSFFNQPKDLVVAKYKRRMDRALGENSIPVDHIAALHDLGYLPVRIKALPEGARVNIRVPLYTIVNTDPNFAWVTNYLESQLSAEFWQVITTATTAFEFRRLLDKAAKDTGCDPNFAAWQGHDFSFRGMADIWSASKSGAAHLISFAGTDTISAIDYLEDYYPDPTDPFIGGSVPATEHAVMTLSIQNEVDKINKQLQQRSASDKFVSKLYPNFTATADEIQGEAEYLVIKHLITEVYPNGIVSIVSDSFDFWRVITLIAPALKEEIMARNGKVVFRPDSGDPVKILVGDPDAVPGSAEFYGAVECLWNTFGGTLTNKQYRVLDEHVGMIYGDSISLDRAKRIVDGFKNKMFASCNTVLGIGSYTYQYETRDTYGTAIKATAGIVDGEFRQIYKDPKTDNGTKKSARGLLRVEFENDNYVLYDSQTWEQEGQGELTTVFENGKLINPVTLSQVRNRLLSELNK